MPADPLPFLSSNDEFANEFFRLAQEGDDSSSFCSSKFGKSEACDDVESGYHYLFLQRNGTKSLNPIIFEDGMDHEECELYYSAISGQDAGGVVRRFRRKTERTVCLGSLVTPPGAKLTSCLRASKWIPRKGDTGAAVGLARRFSFSGLAGGIEENPAYVGVLVRSNSQKLLPEYKPRVGFAENVQVITIYALDDIPQDIKAELWMSKLEMMQSIRGAVTEERRKRTRQLNEEMAAAIKAQELDRDQTSVGGVISECYWTAAMDLNLPPI